MPRPPPDKQQPGVAPNDPEQYRRFVETARELGADESEEAFERAFAQLVPPLKPGGPLPHKPEPGQPTGRRGRPKRTG